MGLTLFVEEATKNHNGCLELTITPSKIDHAMLGMSQAQNTKRQVTN